CVERVSTMNDRRTPGPTRRQFLGGLVAAGAALLAGACSAKSEAKASASKTGARAAGPEVTSLGIGMIPLTDCSSIVVAREKGFSAKHGLDGTVVKGASWRALRDSLSNGDLHATHMLLGMPLASTMGLGGSPVVPMVIPYLINRNRQAITMKAAWK